jgi:hypothetical protein
MSVQKATLASSSRHFQKVGMQLASIVGRDDAPAAGQTGLLLPGLTPASTGARTPAAPAAAPALLSWRAARPVLRRWPELL